MQPCRGLDKAGLLVAQIPGPVGDEEKDVAIKTNLNDFNRHNMELFSRRRKGYEPMS